MGNIQGVFDHQQSIWLGKSQNVELEEMELVKVTLEKITFSQIQGGQVEKLGLYPVDTKGLAEE